MSRQNSMDVASLEVTVNGSQVSVDPIGNGTKPFDDVKVLLVKGADGTGTELALDIADAFSSSQGYVAGVSYCIHEAKLYKCTVNHQGAWNANHFTQVTVDDAFMAKGRDYVTSGKKDGTTLGTKATAEGSSNTSSGNCSHAEGNSSVASGNYSHAEGYSTASGIACHSEGYNTTASNTAAHSEGQGTTASGLYSHSEGYNTVASYNYSHAEGHSTKTGNNVQHVQGKWNVGKGTTAFEIGNGTANNARSNAFEVDWDGDAKLSGNFLAGTKEVYVGSQTANSNYGFTNKNDEISVKVDGTVIATISNTEQKDIVTIVNDTARILTYGNSFTQSVSSSQTINIGCFVLDRTSYIVASGDVLDGSGNRLSEKINTEQVWVTDRKEITTSGWSAEPNASGYYSYSLTASKAFMYNKTPTISASGSSATTLPTDAQAKAYEHIIYPNGYVEHYNETIFKLYAKEKPTSNFYILIRGIRKAQ